MAFSDVFWKRLQPDAPLSFAVLFAVFLLTNWLSTIVYIRTGQLLTIRPHLGIALAICLFCGNRSLWSVLICEFSAALIIKRALFSQPFLTDILTSANVVGTVLAIYLATNLFIKPKVDFRDWRHLITVIAISGAVSTATGILFGFEFARPSQQLFQTNWLAWTASTVLACAIVTPTITLALTANPALLRTRKLQILASLTGILATTAITFIPSKFPTVGLILMALVLVALIVEIEIVALCLLLIQIAFTAATLAGYTPSVLMPLAMGQRLFFAETAFAIITALVLPTAAAISERRKLLQEYKDSLAREAQTNLLLRTSEERYRLLAENASDIIAQSDRDGNIVYASPSGERILGYSMDEVIGKHSMQFVLDEDRDWLQKVTAEYLLDNKGRPPKTVQYRVRHKNGQTVWLENHPSLLRDANGAPQGWISCMRDITEKKKHEAELAELSIEFTHVARMSAIGQMSAAIAHEINQPLMAIANYANAARRYLDAKNDSDDAVANAREAIGKAAGQSIRAGAIVRGLRDFLEKRPREVKPQNLNDVLREAMNMSLLGDLVSSTQIVERMDPQAIPVQVDRVQMQQVIHNLLRNAVEAVEGAVSQKIIISTGISDDGFAYLEVQDSGPGIPDDQLPDLFQSFKTTKEDGMGMGLSISKTIVDAHGGTIELKTGSLAGACFRVRIPLVRDAAIAS